MTTATGWADPAAEALFQDTEKRQPGLTESDDGQRRIYNQGQFGWSLQEIVHPVKGGRGTWVTLRRGCSWQEAQDHLNG